MSTVLDVLPEVASWRATEASTETIYRGEGSSLSAQVRRAGRSGNPAYRQALLEATHLYGRVVQGSKRAALDFQEAMTTSDFQHLFGDILDRQILANYRSMPVQWDRVARRGRVRDFRTVKRFTIDGGEAILDEVKQQSEYPAASLVDGKYEYGVKKFGRRIPLAWEVLINDDLDAFADIPTRLGTAARRSEERFGTSLYASSTGPNSTFFSSGNKNLLAVADVQAAGGAGFTTTALNTTSLQAAFTKLAAQVDTDGAPIYIESVYLVVPPALEVVARNIINATEIVAASGGGDGTGNDQLRVSNWMQNRVTLIVNPWLPIIDTTSGNTAWYLFADPSVGRPAMEVGFLIGHETPELFQKHPNATRVGGGAADPMDGDFDTDSIEWKLRHVYGGVLMDSKSGLAANGTNSP
ncbi:Mu-like prophage major head subunit gpT family protein [Nonomuraea sp. NPDC050790]|uniref:phage major capsid protein n=1 Tax=Nonomuraea sp. NPDC050790 TaxID=3364371 RepID=UPI00379022A1